METFKTRGGWLFAVMVLVSTIMAGCDSSSASEDIGENCSVAFDSPDNSFLKAVNTLDKHIDVVYASLPFGGTVNERSCDLFGVFANRTETFRIQECESGDYDADGFPVDCGLSGPTRSVQIAAAQGETVTIIVDRDFFR